MGGNGLRAAGLAIAIAAWLAMPAPAAAVPHTVQPGETLSGVAYANGLTTDALAAANGLDSEAYLIAGETIEVSAPGETVATTTTGSGHVVQPGETLSGIAYANGLTTESLAAANGLTVDGLLIAGTTLTISGSAGSSVAAPVTAGPSASLGLAPGAAESWDAMHAAALADYGVDLQSAGPLSGYRTYEQQAYLYDLYLSGLGEPANPPGTSTHELGVAVDLADPGMRSIVDQIGWAYGWAGTIPSEWWHVEYVG